MFVYNWINFKIVKMFLSVLLWKKESSWFLYESIWLDGFFKSKERSFQSYVYQDALDKAVFEMRMFCVKS